MKSAFLLLLALGGAASSSATPIGIVPAIASQRHRELVDRFQAWLGEVRELEGRFRGSVSFSDSTLLEMSKVDFILGQARYPRRFLHRHDHNFVFSAVRGQAASELEQNLSAICNYIQLATASRMYVWKAAHRKPLVGPRRDYDKLRAIAKRVQSFRETHLADIEAGTISPARVLTYGNLDELGRRETLEELVRAYDAGQEQYEAQRNSVVFVFIGVQVVIGFAVALIFVRRSKPLNSIRSIFPRGTT